jgi:hypothetical protein
MNYKIPFSILTTMKKKSSLPKQPHVPNGLMFFFKNSTIYENIKLIIIS